MDMHLHLHIYICIYVCICIYANQVHIKNEHQRPDQEECHTRTYTKACQYLSSEV